MELKSLGTGSLPRPLGTIGDHWGNPSELPQPNKQDGPSSDSKRTNHGTYIRPQSLRNIHKTTIKNMQDTTRTPTLFLKDHSLCQSVQKPWADSARSQLRPLTSTVRATASMLSSSSSMEDKLSIESPLGNPRFPLKEPLKGIYRYTIDSEKLELGFTVV